MSHEGAKQAPSTEWSELLAKHPSYEPTSYKALDNLEDEPDLAFLHGFFWDEIRAWTKNDDTEMTHIKLPELPATSKIFIGGMNHALNEKVLEENNIEAIITIHPKDTLAWDRKDSVDGLRRFFAEEQSDGQSRSVVKYPLIIPLEDNANSNLIDYFPQTNAFIHKHVVEGGRNMLIHCKSGRSRSVAVLIAYLVHKFCSERFPTIRDPEAKASKEEQDSARDSVSAYREHVTNVISTQRLPVVVIMARFNDLLELYDYLLVGHPGYGDKKSKKFPVPQTARLMMPPREDSFAPSPGPKKSKKIKSIGGAAVLRICVAWVFFRNGQKPTEPVVHQFFEIDPKYFYELEGLEYEGIPNAGSKHMCPGLVAFCLKYARDEYGLDLPRLSDPGAKYDTEKHADLVVSMTQGAALVLECLVARYGHA